MLYHFLVAVAGVVGLFGVWLAVQSLARRSSAESATDPDVLACRTCGTYDDCPHCGGSSRTETDARTTRKT